MTSIRWVHLTDFHQGTAEQDRLWPAMRDRFFEDLERLTAKMGGPLDLVLFSGDLTQKGTPEEFQQLEDTFGRFWDQFRKLGGDPVLLAVPGNHDLARPPAKKPAVKALSAWWDDKDIPHDFWNDESSEYRQLITEAFKPYTDWQKDSRFHASNIKRGKVPGDFAFTLEKNGSKLGVIGLNSAFLQLTPRDYKGRLALDARQLQAVCDDSSDWLAQHDATILLTHHPQDWLHPDAMAEFEQEILARDNFALHLFGHMHLGASESTRRGGGPTRRSIQGRSLFGLEQVGEDNQLHREHGYGAGQLDFEDSHVTLSFWPRTATLKQGNYRDLGADPNAVLDEENSAWTERFPRRNISPRRRATTQRASSPAQLDTANSEVKTVASFIRSAPSAGDYARLNERARAAVNRLSIVGRQLGWESVARQGHELLKVLQQEPYRVVITGRSRAGKSTLLNSLVGRVLCPVQRTLTTAVPIIITPGERELITVRFEKDAPHRIDGPVASNMLAPYADQFNNPDNKKGVVDITVELTDQVLDLGVMYVDIPGFDDPSERIWPAAEGVIKSAHALVLVLDVSTVATGGFTLDRDTRDLLQSARDRKCAVFVACNKADSLNPDDLRAAEHEVRKRLERFQVWEVLAHPPFFLSASEASSARERKLPNPPAFDAFYNTLWESLWKTESIGLRRLYRVFEQLLVSSEEVEVLIASRQAKEPERVRLREAVKRCAHQRDEIIADCRRAIDHARERSKELIQQSKEEFRAEIHSWIKALPPHQELPAPSKAVDSLKGQLLKRWQGILESVLLELGNKLAPVDQRMKQSLAELRAQAGLPGQPKLPKDFQKALSSWREQVGIPDPSHPGRWVSPVVGALSLGLTLLAGPLGIATFLAGGTIAAAASWIAKFFSDHAKSPAELEASVIRAVDDNWTKFSGMLTHELHEIRARIEGQTRSHMTQFMDDMQGQLGAIRAVSSEELQLFDELKQESQKALALLHPVFRETAVSPPQPPPEATSAPKVEAGRQRKKRTSRKPK